MDPEKTHTDNTSVPSEQATPTANTAGVASPSDASEKQQSEIAIQPSSSKDETDTTSSSLLAHLSSDVELYHKRVLLKRQLEEKLEKGELKRAKIQEEEKEQQPEQEDINEEENTPEPEESPQEPRNLRGKSRNWTKAEDDAIVYYKEELKYSWKDIEKVLRNRHSWQAIQMRYLRNHKSRNDSWSRFMELRLINAIRKDWENRWKRISRDLGNDLTVERCVLKNVEICKKLDDAVYAKVFQNKEITAGYGNPNNDIKDEESHRKLMLVYMGLDSISYESDGEEK